VWFDSTWLVSRSGFQIMALRTMRHDCPPIWPIQ
jgi:hypothetical protein